MAAGGEQGVRDVLEMFRREIALAMTLAGCAHCGHVTRDHVQHGPAPG
ncbi:MAG: alpha-hydroxy-acid oxidizing protein [Thermoleophilaceae bacterium]